MSRLRSSLGDQRRTEAGPSSPNLPSPSPLGLALRTGHSLLSPQFVSMARRGPISLASNTTPLLRSGYTTRSPTFPHAQPTAAGPRSLRSRPPGGKAPLDPFRRGQEAGWEVEGADCVAQRAAPTDEQKPPAREMAFGGRGTTLKKGKESPQTGHLAPEKPNPPNTAKCGSTTTIGDWKQKKEKMDKIKKGEVKKGKIKPKGKETLLPALMPGDTIDMRLSREKKARKAAIAAAESDARVERRRRKAERKAEREARCAARERVCNATLEEIQPVLEAIDWDVVLGGGQVRAFRTVPKHLVVIRPPQEVIEMVDRNNDRDEGRLLRMGDPYLLWVHRVLQRVRYPDRLDAETVRRNRRKLAVLRARAADVLEVGHARGLTLDGQGLGRDIHDSRFSSRAERQSQRDEMKWTLQTYQDLATELALNIWDVQEETSQTFRFGGTRGVKYIDGLPVGLRPEVPRLVPSRWKSQRDAARNWSACAQCEAAGKGDCSSERFMAEEPAERPCSRCRRLDMVCVRLDPYKEDEEPPTTNSRWEWYEAADQKSLSREEAKTVARELLTKRGKKFVNICGTTLDAEDVKRFVPLPALALHGTPVDGNLSDEHRGGGNVPLSANEASRADSFAERMARIRTDVYWDRKAKRFGPGQEDWRGLKDREIRPHWDIDREPQPLKLLAI